MPDIIPGNKRTFCKSHLIYLYLVIVSFFHFSLYSCSDQMEENKIQFSAKVQSDAPGIYSEGHTVTRSSEGGYWESWDTIKLGNYNSVNTPWNESATASTVPHEFLEDIKYDDGWDIKYPKTEEEMNALCQRDTPYLIFHNRYTGILKVFSYLTKDSFYPNNHGIWQISTTDPTSLFAFQNDPVTRIDEKRTDIHYVSNITTNSSCGFSVGWNCFQIELAYDPTQSGWMKISTCAYNSADLTFDGITQSETSGVMSTSSGEGNHKSGIAKLAGDKAGKWIGRQIEDKKILGISSDIIAEGIKAIVTEGAGSIIGAVTGLFKSNNSTRSFQLTTNGTISIKGNATFIATTGITPIEFNIDPSKIGYLGVWGLMDEPTLLFSPYAVLKSPQEHSNGYTREYRVNIVNNFSAKADITVNPELKKYGNCGILTDYFQSSKFTRYNTLGSSGSYGRDPLNFNKIYDHIYKPNFYMIVDVAFKGKEGVYVPIDEFDAPMEVFIPNVPGGPQGAIPQMTYNSSFLASVGVKITLPNGSEAYSYHHCLPKIGWNLSEYDNGLYWFFYPCEPVNQYNTKDFEIQLSNESDKNESDKKDRQ